MAEYVPLRGMPERLPRLGFRGVNVNGTDAIVPPLIPVPAGSFLMGSDKSHDPDAHLDELPQHRVEVDAFQLAKYPVTVAEYALALRAGAVREPLAEEASASLGIESVTWATQQQRPDHPVVCVLWEDAMVYSDWLAITTGQRGWRLPTEPEWEKAARWDQQRSVSRIYPWGDVFDPARCNTIESDLKTTTRVGSYPATDARRSGASPYGVEEMAGNVWEWTSSVFEWYPSAQDEEARDRQESPEYRTLRGGSWAGAAQGARAACRLYDWWDFPSTMYGFRLAFSPEAGS